MHKAMTLLAAGTALLATPALAQLGIGGSVNVGGNVGLDSGPVVDKATGVTGQATDRVGQAVDRVDGTVNDTVDSTDLTLATREQVRTGAELTDTRGNSIGTIQSVDGNTAVVVRGGKLYNVPMSAIYRRAADKTDALVTRLSRAEISAHVDADAEARAN